MTARPGLAAGLCLAIALAGAGCAGRGGPVGVGRRHPPEAPAPYRPDRRDYQAFRAALGEGVELLEPNYLPFMAHRFADAGGGDDWLLFCRWPDTSMPLSVHVHAPAIPESLQDEFDPREPAVYADAVERALARWEGELEGHVTFASAPQRAGAAVVLELVPERAPEADPDRRPLGGVRLTGACRPRGWERRGERAAVDYAVPPLRVYLADEFGLLTPDQVEWIALHEIGHALGMRAHSPIPADLMYEQVRDRVRVPGLSAEDVNSFVDLYRLSNGTVFGRVPRAGRVERSPPEAPRGPPALELAPHVDSRLGFSLQPPRGWMRVDTGRGVVAVDGVTWDYSASFQVVVERYPTLEAYLARYAEAYLSRGRVQRVAPLVVRGRRALHAQLLHPDGLMTEELTFIESGDGRVIVLIADCPAELAQAYRPWFRAAMSSLEIWDP